MTSGVGLIVENGLVVTMDPERRVLAGNVAMEGGRIAAVGPGASVHGPVERIDASGKVVIPGLIQVHVHLCQTLFRGAADDLDLFDWLRGRIWPMEAALDETSMAASVRLGIAELLLGGTTTVLDMGTVRHTRVIMEEAARMGIRGVFGKALMDHPAAPAGLREPLKDAMAESASLATQWHGAAGGRIRYSFAPRFALSSTDEGLRAAAEAARRLGCLMHTHAAESHGEVDVVRRERGKANVSYLHDMGLTGPDCVLAHCIHVGEEELDLLATTGTGVAHCPSSNLKLASGVARVPEMLTRGIHVGLGADGAACNNTLDAFQEMRLAALVQKVRLGPAALTARRVFEMATIEGAAVLGLDAEVGSIEPGKRADLVILDLDRPHAVPGGDVYGRLVYSARAADVETVLVDGRVLVRDRLLLTADTDQVVARAREESARVMGGTHV